jgi:hypothetical protein
LISALSQRSSQVGIAIHRIRELESVDRQTIHQNFKVMFSEDLWDSHRRATSHAFAVLGPYRRRGGHRRDRPHSWCTRKITGTGAPAANPSATHPVDPTEAANVSHAINAASEQVKSYAICKLGVSAYDEQGRPVNRLNVLSPE